MVVRSSSGGRFGGGYTDLSNGSTIDWYSGSGGGGFKMTPDQAIDAGSDILSGIMSYNAEMKVARAKRAWQAYSNTMVDLSNAVSQNTITDNSLLSETAFAQEAIDIRRQKLVAAASTEVQAAAAGVKGGSVDRAMVMISRSAAEADRNRQIKRESTLMAFEQQRVNSGLRAAMQKDYSYIPKPSFAAKMFTAITNSAKAMM
jgi:hypothetical protein